MAHSVLPSAVMDLSSAVDAPDLPLSKEGGSALTSDASGGLSQAGRSLGLYDDPGDLDAAQLMVEDWAMQLEDVEDGQAETHLPIDPDTFPASGIPPGTDGGASLALPPIPPVPGEAVPEGDLGPSEPPHLLFARAVDLPVIPPPRPPSEVYDSSHRLWYIRSILLLIVFLHTRHHVTFRACDLALSTVRSIFVALQLIESSDSMPSTLTTALKRLDLTDRFHILIECPQCRRLLRPEIINPQTRCPVCGVPLFSHGSRSILLRLFGRAPTTSIPKAVTPFRLLSAALVYLLRQPGIEKHMDAWRYRRPPPPGVFSCIQDGRRWKTIEGYDGKQFFGPDFNGELRIGVILHVDWYVSTCKPWNCWY